MKKMRLTSAAIRMGDRWVVYQHPIVQETLREIEDFTTDDLNSPLRGLSLSADARLEDLLKAMRVGNDKEGPARLAAAAEVMQARGQLDKVSIRPSP